LPDMDHSQKKFNTGIVVVVEHGHLPSTELLERANGIRERWIDYLETTTGHRASMAVHSTMSVELKILQRGEEPALH
jgi:hypothetical protein